MLNQIETKTEDERQEVMVMHTKMEDKTMTEAVLTRDENGRVKTRDGRPSLQV